eukprot:10184466-Lingulodinium_polyedra.AAC.1
MLARRAVLSPVAVPERGLDSVTALWRAASGDGGPAAMPPSCRPAGGPVSARPKRPAPSGLA